MGYDADGNWDGEDDPGGLPPLDLPTGGGGDVLDPDVQKLLQQFAVPEDVVNLSPQDYYDSLGSEDNFLRDAIGSVNESGYDPFVGPETPAGWFDPTAYPSSQTSVDEGLTGMTATKKSALEQEPGYLAGGKVDPETGLPEQNKSIGRKFLDYFTKPELDANGKPVNRPPASSASGMAASAAKGAQSSRNDEANILLKQDQNQIQKAQLELLREKFLRNQKAHARFRTLKQPFNPYSAEDQAAAAAEMKGYNPFGPIPQNQMPTASWWEKLLGGYGTVAPIVSAAAKGNL